MNALNTQANNRTIFISLPQEMVSKWKMVMVPDGNKIINRRSAPDKYINRLIFVCTVVGCIDIGVGIDLENRVFFDTGKL